MTMRAYWQPRGSRRARWSSPTSRPAAAAAPTTLWDESGRPVPREALLEALLWELDRWYGAARHGDLAAVWQAYRERLSTLGQRVRVAAGEVTVDGVAEDVVPDGGLVVRL